MAGEWTVYGLVDPRDRSVFYIGRSTNVAKRERQHRTDPASSAWGTCREIIRAGSEAGLVIFCAGLGKHEAKLTERALILALPGLANLGRYHGEPILVP